MAADRFEPHWLNRTVRRSPKRDRGPFFHFEGAADHRNRRGPDQGRRSQDLVNSIGHLSDSLTVGCGREQHGQVGRWAYRFEYLADHLADRAGRVGLLR